MKITYVERNDPIVQIDIENGAKHFDLVLNKAKHGRTIRIADKYNENRVQITLDKVDELIEALTKLNAFGVPTSVEDVRYAV